MEDLVKQVDELLNQFLREEIGNKVTQFNMKGFRIILVSMILNYKPKGNEVKREEFKSEVKKEDAKK